MKVWTFWKSNVCFLHQRGMNEGTGGCVETSGVKAKTEDALVVNLTTERWESLCSRSLTIYWLLRPFLVA